VSQRFTIVYKFIDCQKISDKTSTSTTKALWINELLRCSHDNLQKKSE